MKYLLSFALLVLPAIASADTFENLNDVVEWALDLVNSFILPFLVAIALIAFFWRNIIALAKKDELASKAEMKWYLFWAVIALFTMVSVWGLVGILADIFGIDNAIPQLETNGGGEGGDDLPPCGPPLASGTPCDDGEGNLLPCSIAAPGDPCIPDDPLDLGL